MMYYRLFFLLLSAHTLSAMQNPYYSRVPSLKALAAQKVQELAVQKVQELGLERNIIAQNLQDDVFIEEFRHIPEPIVEKHKQRMLGRIQRDNSIAPCNKRVQEKIYTYNALAYMNKKVR